MRRSQRRRRLRDRKRKELESLEGYFGKTGIAFTFDEFRGLHAMACKYVLPKKHWNHATHPHVRTVARANPSPHPRLLIFFRAFCSMQQQAMEQKTDVTALLKYLARYKDSIHKPRCHRKTRKKRLRQLRQEAAKRLRNGNFTGNRKKLIQGLRAYEDSLRRTFF